MDTADNQKSHRNPESNPDPITGEPGSHPIGTSVGTAGGGITGAALGAAVGGPVGAAVGAVVGGVVGAYSGRGVAEVMHPTQDEKTWRAHHAEQEWRDEPYESYMPAYRVGYEGATRHAGRDYHEVEREIARDYETAENLAIPWERAKPAARTAWHKVSGVTGPRDSDRGLRSGL